MPKEVDNIEFVRKTVRNWKQILDGKVYSLTKGEDFTGNTKGMVTQAYNAARKHGKKVRTRTEGDTVYIQGYVGNGEVKAKPAKKAKKLPAKKR